MLNILINKQYLKIQLHKCYYKLFDFEKAFKQIIFRFNPLIITILKFYQN
jgi:hypothetical protein